MSNIHYRCCDTHKQFIMNQKSARYTISLKDCLEDIAENFIYAESEYSQVPSFVLVPIMFEAINEWIDEFEGQSRTVYKRTPS